MVVALLALGASGAGLEETLCWKNFRDLLGGKIWRLPLTFWSTTGLHPGYKFSFGRSCTSAYLGDPVTSECWQIRLAGD